MLDLKKRSIQVPEFLQTHKHDEGLIKGNSSITLFESHKLIEKKKSGLKTKTEGNTLNIRGKHLN